MPITIEREKCEVIGCGNEKSKGDMLFCFECRIKWNQYCVNAFRSTPLQGYPDQSLLSNEIKSFCEGRV